LSISIRFHHLISTRLVKVGSNYPPAVLRLKFLDFPIFLDRTGYSAHEDMEFIQG